MQLQQCTFSVYFTAINITANTPSGILSPLRAYMEQPLTTTVKVPATTATIFSYRKTNGTLCSNTSLGGGWGGGGQKAAWNLMTSKGLFAAQVQPPPNFCPLLVPPALIGLIEDKLFEMDAQ